MSSDGDSDHEGNKYLGTSMRSVDFGAGHDALLEEKARHIERLREMVIAADAEAQKAGLALVLAQHTIRRLTDEVIVRTERAHQREELLTYYAKGVQPPSRLQQQTPPRAVSHLTQPKGGATGQAVAVASLRLLEARTKKDQELTRAWNVAKALQRHAEGLERDLMAKEDNANGNVKAVRASPRAGILNHSPKFGSSKFGTINDLLSASCNSGVDMLGETKRFGSKSPRSPKFGTITSFASSQSTDPGSGEW